MPLPLAGLRRQDVAAERLSTFDFSGGSNFVGLQRSPATLHLGHRSTPFCGFFVLFRTFSCLLFRLVSYIVGYHLSPFHLCCRIDLCDIRKLFRQAIQQAATLILIRNFASLEDDRCFYLMSLFNERPRMTHLELKVMRIRIRMEPDLLYLRHMLVLLLKLFLLGELVLVLPEVHDLAYWWIGIRNNLDQIQPAVGSHLQRFLRPQHSHLMPFFVNEPDFRSFDFCVDARALLLDGGFS